VIAWRARALAPVVGFTLAACGSGTRATAEAGRPGAGLPQRATVTTAAETCGNAVDDNGNGLAEEGCGIPGGLVGFVAAWDEPTADVDLRVIDPSGELAETGRPTGSGLVKERDCPGRDGECRSRDVENVYLERGEILRGEYRVHLRLVSMGGEEPPIEVRFAARLGQKSYGAVVSLRRVEESWEALLRL
jgi:tRNA (guanosine-2'-O-)-methyltransferase